jgi:hypothetical protein
MHGSADVNKNGVHKIGKASFDKNGNTMKKFISSS